MRILVTLCVGEVLGNAAPTFYKDVLPAHYDTSLNNKFNPDPAKFAGVIRAGRK